MSFAQRINYFSWAARNYPFADTTCPACCSPQTQAIKRKAVFTVLFECDSCRLRFRVPKDDLVSTKSFYQTRYRQGATTECPTETELETLIASKFVGSANDFTTYIEILRVLGMKAGDSVFDFGASWGYGSWQLNQVGTFVYSYEVSEPRANYARQYLGCRMISDLDEFSEKMDFFFSAHVIEHLPDPNVLWRAARRILKPSGKLVLFMPNGEPKREESCAYYHLLWGQVHPLLLTQTSLQAMANHHGFDGLAFSSPYDFGAVKFERQLDQPLLGEELLFIATLK